MKLLIKQFKKYIAIRYFFYLCIFISLNYTFHLIFSLSTGFITFISVFITYTFKGEMEKWVKK